MSAIYEYQIVAKRPGHITLEERGTVSEQTYVASVPDIDGSWHRGRGFLDRQILFFAMDREIKQGEWTIEGWCRRVERKAESSGLKADGQQQEFSI